MQVLSSPDGLSNQVFSGDCIRRSGPFGVFAGSSKEFVWLDPDLRRFRFVHWRVFFGKAIVNRELVLRMRDW